MRPRPGPSSGRGHNPHMALAVGTVAPDFALKSPTEEGFAEVRLSDFRGKKNVVLLFFPGAFTGVCTQEMCEMSSGLGAWEALDAAVFGVSADTGFAQNAWAKANDLKVPLLSDYARKTINDYDVVLDDLAGMGPSSQRAVFVIDKEGVIRYVEVTPTPATLPNMAAAKAALATLG
jgi:glutaredoxin-dependent peroxiredoxin